MGGKTMTITVYHGGTEQVNSPLCRLGRENLDFGRGFYVTDIKEQAYRWAITTAKRRKTQAVINIYQLDRDAILTEARCKIFKAYDTEWLNFIVASRRGENPATATLAAVMCVATTAMGLRLRIYSLKAGNIIRDHAVPPPQRRCPVSVYRQVRS